MDHPETHGCEKSESIDRSFSSPPEASQNPARSSAPAPRSNTPEDTCRPGLSDQTIERTLLCQSTRVEVCSSCHETPLPNNSPQNPHCGRAPRATLQTVGHRQEARHGLSSDSGGNFATYHSIEEYLAQRNIHPLFLTDTEVSVLLFDLLSRVYKYPLEYLIEALAPTTERDFEMLPEEKKRIYRLIQSTNIHVSPEWPSFFIVARNDVEKNAWQLLGIPETSMLRPQLFAVQEGPVKIGIIASERQAINAALGKLQESP